VTVRFWIAFAVRPGFAELIEAKDRVLSGAKGRECRVLLGLVEKAPVYIFRFLDQAPA
jgi:hypothetical protein